MKERITQVRKGAKLNQDEFAKRIGLTKNYISLMETGGRVPSDRTIGDICREFNVNEFWLRTGEGEMCRVKTRKEEMTEFATKFVGGELSEFQTNLINVISKLDADQIALLANIADTMAKEWQKEKTGE